MPGNDNSNSEQLTKIISLDNLDTFKDYIEERNIQVTRLEYEALPSSKLTNGKSYFITDEGVVIKNNVEYGGLSGGNTTYNLSAGTGDDANKIILTPSSGTPDKVTVPYATNSGTVNGKTVESNVPSGAVFTDTTYELTADTTNNKITLTPSTGSAQSITVPYATSAGDAGTVNSHTVAKDVPSDAVFTDTTYSNATTAVAGLMSTDDKSKLNGIASGAEVNQNAFSSIVANGTTVSADSKTDTLTIEAGSNVSISGDSTNDKITISATDTTYSNATTASHGLMSKSDKTKLDGIASGAEVNQNAFSNIVANGTTVSADSKTDTLTIEAGSNITLLGDATNDKVTISATDTTYSNATTTASGLMSSDDKTKLDGIAAGAEVNQNAFGNVKVGSTTIVADAKKDTLELAEGTGITITGDATNDKVTITNKGVRSVATGTSNGTINVNTNGSTANVPVYGLGSAAYTASTDYIASTLKGANNGVAELDSTGKVPSSQLPSFVDDVLEYDSLSDFPLTGEEGKIYVAKDTNKTYRWSGSAYVEISPSLALGETSSTAYRGDRGKIAYNHSQATGNPHGTTKADLGLGSVVNLDQSKAIYSITRSSKTFTATALDGSTFSFTQQDNNTTYSNATTAAAGLMSKDDKSKLDGIASGAEVNQNAFSNVKVGSTTVAADSKTDTLQLVAGGAVTLTPDATNDKITISSTDTKYTASTISVGSASTGTAIPADDITAWTQNTPTSAVITNDVLVFTAGTKASLSYTPKSIPNISVSSKTVVSGITES